MSLTRKTTVAVIWNFAEQLGRRAIQFGVTLVLAIYLLPEEFGLVAMMAVFIAIAMAMMESGFGQALIRQRNVSDIEFNTAYFANIGLGFVGYVLLFLCAPFIAVFYDEHRLTDLIRVASAVVIVSAMYQVQLAILSRNLDFDKQLRATIPAHLVSGLLAIALAYLDYGAWALVSQTLVSGILTMCLMRYLIPWRPHFAVSKRSLGVMYRFGYKLFLSRLIDTIYKNIYVLIIAKMYGASSAGLYFFADKIRDLIVGQLVNTIQTVTYPALSRVRSDKVALKNGYRSLVSVTTFILFPAMLLISALAEPAVVWLLPDHWSESARYLQLLCLAALFHPLHAINLNILKVEGRSDIFLYLEVAKKILLTSIIIVSMRYGILGILIGQIVFSLLAFLPNAYFASALIGYTMREQVTDFSAALVLSMFVALTVHLIVININWPAAAKVFVFSIAGGVVYIGVAHIASLRAYGLFRSLLGRLG